MDKLQGIQYFLRLAETLSFKGTAAQFGVPPSAVSRAIAALEAELGVHLVERTTRKVRLTETGHWYRGEVTGPLRSLAAAEEMASAHAGEPTGTIRLTAIPGYGELRLFSALKRFRAQHPRIVCDLELSDRYLDLSSGDIDLALRATSTPPDYLVARRLHSHRFVLVAAPDYLDKHGRPRTLNDMADHAALCYRGAQGVAPWLCLRDGGEAVPVPRRPVLVTNNGLLLRQAALEGEGMAFLPDWGVVQGVSEGQLEEVSLEDGRLAVGTGPEMSLYLLYDPQKARLGKVKALVEFLVRELSQPG